jgi:glycerophosphoryl diester phosphodiesterase
VVTVRVVGHRGCPLRGPENTVGAFRRAAPHVDWIEVDVRRCGSGDLVVFHDDDLDRLLGASGTVAETALADLRAHSVLDSDETVPTLSEALAAIPPEVGVNVELKETGVAADAARIWDAVDNEIVVSSFSREALRAAAAASDAPLAVIEADDWQRALDDAADLDCEFVHPEYHLVLDDPGRVADAHDRDLGVNAWTIREPDPVDPLRDAGVDGLVVDDWALVGR